MPKRRIKAIETRYKGCRFRSRLEARWAVFYNALGLKWEYEKEGFELPSGRYLPDFYLPGIGWIEIKGADPDDDDPKGPYTQCYELAEHLKQHVFLFYGSIGLPQIVEGDAYGDPANSCPSSVSFLFFKGYGVCGGEGWWWTQCPLCGKFDITCGGRLDDTCCGCMKQLTSRWRAISWPSGYDSPELREAYRQGRSARFEFGEKGGNS